MIWYHTGKPRDSSGVKNFGFNFDKLEVAPFDYTVSAPLVQQTEVEGEMELRFVLENPGKASLSFKLHDFYFCPDAVLNCKRKTLAQCNSHILSAYHAYKTICSKQAERREQITKISRYISFFTDYSVVVTNILVTENSALILRWTLLIRG